MGVGLDYSISVRDICGADWRNGKALDFGPRGPRFEPQPGRRSLWP